MVREKIEYYGFTVDFKDSEEFKEIWLSSVDKYKNAFEELGTRLTE